MVSRRGRGGDRLAQPRGPDEGPWAQVSMAELVLPNNRGMLHHRYRSLLRDLYLWHFDRRA
jgi:hypothetical protein